MGTVNNNCAVVTGASLGIGRIERNGWFSRSSALSPEEVADEVLSGMFKGKKVILPGKLSKLFFRVGSFIPEGIMLWLTRRIFRNYQQG